MQVIASGKGPLIATISWTDPEADPLKIDSTVVNKRTLVLDSARLYIGHTGKLTFTVETPTSYG
ncbi:hypothetical protein AHMF7605_02925 [Adhaeribacter arboris]|uniref:Uncharacterized protein n=1 Tax=Adhaeribacter arboris TaxID=2072846 RepID=A0A2T2YAJ0_9BACT|nr:hypothetical protein [Adhaeribacter arboris]PSR52551.1 hypothetical protein AHMF7605_02925 [Adhaeribacter arboris]